ncbi:unnamed protein product, partial [Rotaria socialis]
AHEAQFDQHKSLITDNRIIYVLKIMRGGCFLPDTLVMLADKSQVPIYSIQPGDNLLSFTGTGEIVTTVVQEVFSRTVDNFIELHVYENTTILVTPDHLIFTGNNSFTPLRKLSVDDTVFVLSEMDNSLKTVPIKSFKSVTALSTCVYNLHTAEPHTYFANGIAVHNMSGDMGAVFVDV